VQRTLEWIPVTLRLWFSGDTPEPRERRCALFTPLDDAAKAFPVNNGKNVEPG
jgi:hypothetical protein